MLLSNIISWRVVKEYAALVFPDFTDGVCSHGRGAGRGSVDPSSGGGTR
jgi:hypothetical protein